MADRLKLDDRGGEQGFEPTSAKPGEALDVRVALGKAAEALDRLIQGADRAGGDKG